jgi:16S rRNA (guanine527-N7)-methyltransferase
MEFEEFVEVCNLNRLVIEDKKLDLLKNYVELLLEWNKRVNLISRKETDVWGRHILHCISPLFKIEIEPESYILDLGTGGGLPGIPWAILNDQAKFALLDGTRKKIEAVSDILKKLGLENAKAVWGRAEEVSKNNNFRGKFDYIICRSVAELKKLVKWSFNFLNSSNFSKKFLEETNQKYYLYSGCLIAFKGGDIEKEIGFALKTSFVADFKVIDLTFKGDEKVSFEDKKVVLLKLTTK